MKGYYLATGVERDISITRYSTLEDALAGQEDAWYHLTPIERGTHICDVTSDKHGADSIEPTNHALNRILRNRPMYKPVTVYSRPYAVMCDYEGVISVGLEPAVIYDPRNNRAHIGTLLAEVCGLDDSWVEFGDIDYMDFWEAIDIMYLDDDDPRTEWAVFVGDNVSANGVWLVL